MPTLETLATSQLRGAVILDQGALATPPSGFATVGVDANGYLLARLDDGTYAQLKAFDNNGIGQAGVWNDSAHGNTNGARWTAYRAETGGLLSGQRISRLCAGGNTAGGAGIGLEKVAIDFDADGDWTTHTDTPTRISFKTTSDGSGTNTERMSIENDGEVAFQQYSSFAEATEKAAVTNKVVLQGLDVGGETKLVAIMPNGVVIPVAHGEITRHGVEWLRPLNAAQTAKAIAETTSRADGNIANVATSLTSGVMACTTFPMYKGQVVNALSFCTGSTALSGGSNQIFALYKYEWSGGTSAHAQKAVSASDGATAWSTNSIKTLAMSTPYTVEADGIYIAAIMIQATTVPTLMGTSSNANVFGKVPQAAFTTGSGLTNVASLPATISSITQAANRFWAWVT